MYDDALIEHAFHCPYCDAALAFTIDTSQGSHVTWEDCHYCCSPIQLRVEVSPFTGELESVTTGRDDDIV
ncbi:CPXCG motif-containing cysteine-rich protein [Halomonas dongshanensis]|uniref:CPXCG motif-containing cysteine-rich protein n=1 Tax=Halomonas dongshanensis TaxID=2890835 RepID=A0ABT2EBL6_9GAMM|nr:CPXCG motif-containing cysteine-rich protein [Halomonas dongshanensis]MCS2608940.1 CPXCG motif-containing cysteine-rich protein [Halomonas dongshanensis]